MVTKFEKAKRGKLLATIAVLAVMFAGAAVVFGDAQETDAADANVFPTGAITGSGTYTITSTKTGDVNLTTTSTTPLTVTVKMNATENAAVMYKNGTLSVDKNIVLILEMTSTTALTNCHILQDASVTIKEGGSVILKQDANCQGQSWWNSKADESNALTITKGSFTIDGANGLSGVKAVLTDGAKLVVKSTSSSKAAINFANLTVNATAEVTIEDSKVFAQLNGTQNKIDGTFDANASEVRITKDAKVTMGANGILSASEIKAETKDAVNTADGGKVSADWTSGTIEGAIALLESQDEVTLKAGEYTLSKDITIPANKTLVLDGCTINGNGYKIIVEGTLSSNGAYIYAGVQMGENGSFASANTHNNTVTGTMVDNYKVGYGDTLTISGSIPANVTVDAFGKLILNDVTISGAVNTYVGAAVDVQGTVTVSSTLTLKTGAEMELSGTITVKNDANGGAKLVLETGSKLTVLDGGVLNINKPTANSAANNPNKLVVGTGADLIVEGTLNITGMLDGTVQDKGTVVFNGTAGTDAKIVIYDGMSITVTSVTGDLTITDAGIVKDYTGNDKLGDDFVSEGNSVVLSNVKGVTVSESITTKMNKANNTKYYFCNMSVSGTVTKVQNTAAAEVDIIGTGDKVTIDSKDSYGTMSVVDTLSVGKNVIVSTNGNVTVKGTMAAMDDTDGGKIVNKGTLTVEGTLSGIGGNITAGDINAVTYKITSTSADGASRVVEYFTGFAQAINAVGEADEDTITVLGKVKMSESADLATLMTIGVTGTLTISKDVTLTVADGAALNVTGTVNVEGTLVITNSDTGLTVGKLNYDISKVNGKTVTYTSLANALANASEGDVIVLAQNVVLEGNVKVPAGVTLQTGKNKVTLKDNTTLTVDGTFDVQNGGSVVADAANPTLVWGKGVKIVVNGVMTYTGASDAYNDCKISGAYFALKNVNYISNVAYAAEKVNDGKITIKGNVSAGNVTFKAADNKTLNVTIASEAVVSVGSITLDGVTLVATGDISGKIVAATGETTSSVTLSKASGITISSGEQTVNAESVAYMYAFGTLKGEMTVSEGTVYIDGASAGNDLSVTGKDNVFKVASGATAELTGKAVFGAADKDATAVIDGTVNVSGKVTVNGIVKIAGTMNVAKVGNADPAEVEDLGTVIVTGTLNISADENKEGTFTVGADSTTKGILVVGEKPKSLGAAGTVTGDIEIKTTGYVKVYSGASVTDAIFNPNANGESQAKSTAYYINGDLYMTVYVDASANIALVGDNSILAGDIVGNAGLQIPGLDTTGINTVTKWFTDSAMTFALEENKAGKVEAIYADAPAADVKGTISAGTGLDLYIDGVKWNGTQNTLKVGEHTVSIGVKAGYDGSDATISFNGQTVTDGKIVITADMKDFTLVANGAAPATGGSSGSSDDGMSLTDILLIILVVMVVILAIVVILRMMRS